MCATPWLNRRQFHKAKSVSPHESYMECDYIIDASSNQSKLDSEFSHSQSENNASIRIKKKKSTSANYKPCECTMQVPAPKKTWQWRYKPIHCQHLQGRFLQGHWQCVSEMDGIHGLEFNTAHWINSAWNHTDYPELTESPRTGTWVFP